MSESGALAIPPGAKLRLVGDVHGDARAFAHAAAAGDRFVIQLGDLTDHGPDSAEALRLMFRLIDDGRGLFVRGNHDHKLGRVLAGNDARIDHALARTLDGLDAQIRPRALAEIRRAPFWLRHGDTLFVHGAYHPAMLAQISPLHLSRPRGPEARALFGEATGRMRADGYPQRRHDWVDQIPAGLTVYCGHDRVSTDGRPYVWSGRGGGVAVFLDTGAGKGGHLSWMDL